MAEAAAEVRRRLMRWYRRNRRRLPWREDAAAGDAYRVWVSEIMLQQTRVAAAIPYYARFLERFPTVAALAAAPEAEVLAAWSGLGYYRRARQLQRAAQAVVERHGGQFPREMEAAEALPGVGAYTAGAVLSIAYGLPQLAVDANAVRIASRYSGRALTAAAAAAVLRPWLAPRQPGGFNQALMDLGATVCRARDAACPRCPLRAGCRYAGGERLPAGRRAARRKLELGYALRRREGRVWLRQRPGGAAQLAGLWELPEATAAERGRPALGTVRHAITTSDITAHVYPGSRGARRATDAAGTRARWVTPEEAAELPLTGLARKILKRFVA